ncbi:hypothetical protein JCM10908_006560 [Rhodotorula pacifica]|uniref:uncharacterized protein n=1 Tax=Rhodotorula pacifica TaxID=1495444 RepID=UPI00316DD95F
MSASPQANQGLDDGLPLPAAYVPSHTGLRDDDVDDDDYDNDDDNAMAPAKLSQIEQHADENDVKDEEGEPSDDQPEDTGDDPQQDLDEELHPKPDDAQEVAVLPDGGAADEEDEDEDDKDVVRAGGRGEAEDDDEEDEEEEESDDQEEDDRPRKKRRRRRGGAQFLDIEADVDEDEDEEEEEGEEGFVANDNFIVEREARRNRDGSPGPAGADDADDADFAQGDFDGDASHRRLDRRRMAQKDKEAAELAEELNQRYRRNKYTTDGAEDWAPKAMLMPNEKDPRIWGIKCKTGRERDLILSISRKAVALETSDNGIPLAIISAFQRDSLKGFIYVEARSEQDVRTAVHGLIGLYMNGPNGIFLVDIEEMPDLLRTKQKRVDLQPGGWVRFKRGKYAGDLAQIIAPSENGDEIAVKFIPRIDLAPKDDALGVGPDGRKRKKGAVMPLAFRPPQRLFNAEEIGKVYGQKEVQKRGQVLIFKGDEYHDGFCEKDVRVSSLNVEDITPTIDELTRFQGDAAAEAGGALDLTQIADAARTLSKTILQPGDHVDIFEGDQKCVYGTVDSITNEVVIVTPHADLDLEGTKIEVPARSVRKRFKEGDHVKVMQGANADETGLVVKVEGDVVTFLSDLSSTEVAVFSKDVREAAEVGSGINVIAGYELHDLVQLDPQTAGVIIKMERDQFRVLDQTGSVRALKPNQLSGKVQTRFAVATDKDGFDIKQGEVMKESLPNNNSGIDRRGKVLHVYRSMFAFLHSRDITENGGVFVSYARNLESTAPRPNKPSVGMGINPDRMAMMGGPAVPKVQVATGVQMGRDHRINRRVAITRGTYKGNQGVIKDITGNTARVELHSVSKTVTVDIDKLKERTDTGELIPLLDRPGGGGAGGYGARNGFAGGAPGATAANTAPLGGGAPGYGARAGPPGGGMFGAPGGGPAGMYGGGRTPAPQYGGGRTPAPQYGGGKTPAPQYGGGKTPAPQYGGATPYGAVPYGGGAPGMGGATPAYAGAYGRTPHYAGGAASGAASGMGATPNPYGGASSSRTPYGAGLAGGKTPDPRQLAGGRTPAYGSGAGVASGGRTPAYGARNGYGTASAPTPGMQAAPTPAASGSGTAAWDEDDWGEGPAVGAPTPAPNRDNGPDYNGAPTPYAGAPTPAAGAATPGAFLGAPTPGFSGAPTPSAYPSGPTPGPSGSYGAAAQTPGGAAGYYQTPYAGAATNAAEPLEEREMADAVAVPHPSEWVVENVKVVVKQSGFQGGRLTGQHGIIKSHTSSTCTFTLDPYGDLIEDFPIGDVEPMPPYQAEQQVLVISGPSRGERGVTKSSDGDDWFVELRSQNNVVVNVHHLVELVA